MKTFLFRPLAHLKIVVITDSNMMKETNIVLVSHPKLALRFYVRSLPQLMYAMLQILSQRITIIIIIITVILEQFHILLQNLHTPVNSRTVVSLDRVMMKWTNFVNVNLRTSVRESSVLYLQMLTCVHFMRAPITMKLIPTRV